MSRPARQCHVRHGLIFQNDWIDPKIIQMIQNDPNDPKWPKCIILEHFSVIRISLECFRILGILVK